MIEKLPILRTVMFAGYWYVTGEASRLVVEEYDPAHAVMYPFFSWSLTIVSSYLLAVFGWPLGDLGIVVTVLGVLGVLLLLDRSVVSTVATVMYYRETTAEAIPPGANL